MSKLQAFQEMIGEGLKRIPLSGKPVELFEPVRYVIALGGKRMRPVLTLIACDLFDGNPEDALGAAIGIELFHNFSLVHDDIMDNAPLRRGHSTVHEKWNPNTAILSGDAMLILAYREMARVAPDKLGQVLEIFNETALLVCQGQQLDMNFEKTHAVSIKEYLGMIELKTAALLAGCLKIGALTGNAREEDAQRLYEYGRNMGIAFQLQDDILDVYGDTGKFGKQKGGDIISNKKTFLLLKALEVSAKVPYKQEELLQWIYAPDFKPSEKVEAVTSIYDYFNIRTLAETEMEKYYRKALTLLDEIPVDASKKDLLRSLTDSLMMREV